MRSIPDCEWPLDIKNKERIAKSPGNLWTLDRAWVSRSPISCMKKLGKAGGHKILYPLFVYKDLYVYFGNYLLQKF